MGFNPDRISIFLFFSVTLCLRGKQNLKNYSGNNGALI